MTHKYINTHKLYEEIKMIRLDLFIFKLIQNHSAPIYVHKVNSNNFIYSLVFAIF